MEDDQGPKCEANYPDENRSSQYDSAKIEEPLFEVDAKKTEIQPDDSEVTHAEDNKSSESCEIVQRTVESP